MTSSVSRKRATRLRQRPVRGDLTTGTIRPWAGPAPVARQNECILPTIEDVSPVERPSDGSTAVSPLPDLEAHLTRIAEEGYTILPDVLEPDLVDEIDQALLVLEHDLGTVPADNLFEGVRTTRVYNLLVHGITFEKIPIHPNVLPVVEAVLDPGLLISSLSSIAIGPDEQAQPIHADDQLIPLARPHVPIICNTMWALTDFTEENGATRIIPGSHHSDHPPDFVSTYDSIPAEMERGSVLVWVGSLWHGGGANHTNEVRTGIAMNYCAGFIRQQENQQLGIPRRIARTFSPRLQELVGYSLYQGLIGHIDKAHPARVVLDADTASSMLWDAAT